MQFISYFRGFLGLDLQSNIHFVLELGLNIDFILDFSLPGRRISIVFKLLKISISWNCLRIHSVLAFSGLNFQPVLRFSTGFRETLNSKSYSKSKIAQSKISRVCSFSFSLREREGSAHTPLFLIFGFALQIFPIEFGRVWSVVIRVFQYLPGLA